MKLAPIIVLAVLAGFAIVYVPGVVQNQQLMPGLRVSSAATESSNSNSQNVYNVTVSNATGQFIVSCTNISNIPLGNSDVQYTLNCNSSAELSNVTNISYVPLNQGYTPVNLLLWPSLVFGIGTMIALAAYVLVRRLTPGLRI